MTAPRRRWPRVLLGVAVALVVLVTLAVLVLDRILLREVRARTDALSLELGRPITVADVSTRLLGGLGARVSGLSVGAGPGEDAPLLQLDRAEVKAALLRAILSGGKDVEIREAVVRGLRVNVEKLPDGTTNVERLSRQLRDREARQAHQPAAPQAQPAGEGQPTDLSRLRVDRAALEEGRIAFLDRTRPGARELAIDHLDVEVRDLRAGRPLEVVVKAAVLASAQNLELRIKAAPLPPTLVPTPEQLTLKVQPIDLTPLAPFLPAAAGFQGGQFQADLAVVLGAAVPGGKGRTRVQGGFQATQLAFAGQEGGKKLDAVLLADLEGDASAGDLAISRLDFTAGPVGLTGRGRASGLTGPSPRAEGLEIVARGLDPAALEAYYPPLRRQLGRTVIAGPIGLSVQGAGSGAAQALEVRVDLGPVRLEVPGQLAKAAGAPASLVAHLRATGSGQRAGFDAQVELAGVDLRPGGTVAKRPGDPLSLSVAGDYRKAGDAVDLALSRIALNLMGSTLTGQGKVARAGAPPRVTTRFELAVSGPRLDLDRILLPSPEQKPEEKPAPGKPADPAAFAGLSGVASLNLRELRYKGTEVRDVVARVRVQEDQVTFEQAQLIAFGGTVSAAGTQASLAHPDVPFKVSASVKGVQAAQALGLLSKAKVLGGALDAGLQLSGKGTQLSSLAPTLDGSLQGLLHDGEFYGKDLVAEVAAPLAQRLPFAAAKVSKGGATRLGKELPFAFRIANGVAALQKPLEIDTGQGLLQLTGGIRLDGTLQLPATFALSPDLIARLTGGKARPDAPIPLTFALAGSATAPRIEGLSVNAAAQAIAKGAATGAIGRVLGRNPGTAGADVARQKADAEARARAEAEKARKQVEDEASKRLKGLFGK